MAYSSFFASSTGSQVDAEPSFHRDEAAYARAIEGLQAIAESAELLRASTRCFAETGECEALWESRSVLRRLIHELRATRAEVAQIEEASAHRELKHVRRETGVLLKEIAADMPGLEDVAWQNAPLRTKVRVAKANLGEAVSSTIGRWFSPLRAA